MTTLSKIEGVCAFLLTLMMLAVIALFFTCCIAGCSAHKRNGEMTWGIIDACYTVLEYNPKDASERITKYLDSKEKSNTISASERTVIEQCLKRTTSSNKWGVEK